MVEEHLDYEQFGALLMLMLFATVSLVHLVALMNPGPGFFASQTSSSRSRKAAMIGVPLIFFDIPWLHQIIIVGV